MNEEERKAFLPVEPTVFKKKKVTVEAIYEPPQRAGDAAFASNRRGLFLDNFSAHADGERRGLDRLGGWHRKGLGETRL